MSFVGGIVCPQASQTWVVDVRADLVGGVEDPMY